MAENFDDKELREVKSCGFFLMKSNRSFLLMKHKYRYDLPKGHMKNGENEHETALRELNEETGIQSAEIDIDPNFRFEDIYYPTYKRFGGERVKKTLVIFLAKLKSDSVQINPTEHPGFQWFDWNSPPIPIQIKTIDPLLNKVHQYISVKSVACIEK
ncbi:hypothetical protein I4U23_030865 [Adineta vaga]|nr:hypothetical protein I4U23_030865 [Adineta vaga]